MTVLRHGYRPLVVVMLLTLLLGPLAARQSPVSAAAPDQESGLVRTDDAPGTPTHGAPPATPVTTPATATAPPVATTPASPPTTSHGAEATPVPTTSRTPATPVTVAPTTPLTPATPVTTVPAPASPATVPATPVPPPPTPAPIVTPPSTPAQPAAVATAPTAAVTATASATAAASQHIPEAPAGPVPAPAQLLPFFLKASQHTGVPLEVLLAIARVESGFNPHAIGPFIPQLAGTENEHALGMMQFLPGTYRGYITAVDGLTGRQMGVNGIWDPESAIYAAALYLRDNGAPGDMRRALFAYNNANWYVDLILGWAGYYAGGVMPDPSLFNYDGQGRPVILSAPDNPLLPVQNSAHLDVMSPIPLYAPFTAGSTWHAGLEGSFYGRDLHSDAGGGYYAVDFNKGVAARPEEDAGQPVLAAADGIVNNVYASLTGGWTVELFHRTPEGSLVRTIYLHLQDDPRVSANLHVNQPVTHGTVIGFVGNTGVMSTGAHLHFALYLLKDGHWVSIRPEPMEGQFLADGATIVSHNEQGSSKAFDQAWLTSDKQITTQTIGQAAGTLSQRSWVWGPTAFAGGVPEAYADGKDGIRLARYYDKGRMEARSDGKGGYLITAGRLGWELLTGKVDIGGGRQLDYGPAQIPLVGGVGDKNAPTYADAGVEAASRTFDYAGLPVIWQLTRGGKVVPFIPPVEVQLTGYDAVTGHNVADVFARWLTSNGFRAPQHDLSDRIGAQADPFEPGRPLTDPFWVVVTIDGAPRTILVQVFERWTLTYAPDNPAGWQIELGNVGRHYYSWRYEQDIQDVLLNQPPRSQRRRRVGRRSARRATAVA